jgi:hypothetical protein
MCEPMKNNVLLSIPLSSGSNEPQNIKYSFSAYDFFLLAASVPRRGLKQIWLCLKCGVDAGKAARINILT